MPELQTKFLLENPTIQR